VPPPMGLSLGKSISLCLCVIVFLICSCEKHQVGEYPQVQRDLTEVSKQPETATESQPVSPTPSAQPTPAEFFPTKPR